MLVPIWMVGQFRGKHISKVPSWYLEGAVEVRRLRDPGLFEDDDHQLYLFYSVAGEMGIAGGRCRLQLCGNGM